MKRLKKALKKFNGPLIFKASQWLVVFAIGVIAIAAALSAMEVPNGIRLYVVQSGSMAPAIFAGSMVMIKPAVIYREGEVITFKAEKDRFVDQPGQTTTHRIVDIKETWEGAEYITKGDFNDVSDSRAVKKDLVLGKVVFSLPLLGYLVSFAKTLPGLILLIIIPATLIVYNEILNIKREMIGIFQRKGWVG